MRVTSEAAVDPTPDHVLMRPDTPAAPTLLCFDGSDDAAHAIAQAGKVIGGDQAIVLSVAEPIPDWEPYDPATILTAPLSRVASHGLGLDQVAHEVAEETMRRGVELARAAGFSARGRVASGKPWRQICAVAEEIGAGVIVVGARGLGRVESVLLGSVSAAVLSHSKTPILIIPPSA